MTGHSLKQKFVYESAIPTGLETFRILVVLIKQPTGAIEVITNTEHLDQKIEYYLEHYDDEFRSKHNRNVQIIDYMMK